MTYRELLELAAKAAGWELKWKPWPAVQYAEMGAWDEWNPLTDDGDALRLAVKLGFDVSFNFGIVRSPAGEVLAVNEHDIKRAIVRAAAALAG